MDVTDINEPHPVRSLTTSAPFAGSEVNSLDLYLPGARITNASRAHTATGEVVCDFLLRTKENDIDPGRVEPGFHYWNNASVNQTFIIDPAAGRAVSHLLVTARIDHFSAGVRFSDLWGFSSADATVVPSLFVECYHADGVSRHFFPLSRTTFESDSDGDDVAETVAGVAFGRLEGLTIPVDALRPEIDEILPRDYVRVAAGLNVAVHGHVDEMICIVDGELTGQIEELGCVLAV